MCPLSFIFLVSSAFLYCSFKSNSPLTSGVYLIFSLVTISPWMVSLSLGWYTYLLMLLFLSGVFVLVIYMCSFTSVSTKSVSGTILFMVFLFSSSSILVFYVPAWGGMGQLFMSYNIALVLFVILFLVFSITFCSYMMMNKGAMRKF